MHLFHPFLLTEVSDNTLAKYPLLSLTPVVRFPSPVYRLRFASIFSYMFFLALPKPEITGRATIAVALPVIDI